MSSAESEEGQLNFARTPEQELLSSSARDVLATNNSAAGASGMGRANLWRQVTTLGWLGLPIPEEYGGSGGSFVDLVVLLEEIGRAGGPSLFADAVLGILAVVETATDAQKSELLPQLGSGGAIAVLAHDPNGRIAESALLRGALSVTEHGGEVHLLNGEALFIGNADVADYLVAPGARSQPRDQVTSYIIATKGEAGTRLQLTPLSTMSRDRVFAVRFDDVPLTARNVLGTPGEALRPLQRLLYMGAVGLCAQLVGAAQRVLELAVSHGKERVQFGRRIGSFQSIQHQCADMFVDVELSRLMTYQAAWCIDTQKDISPAVSMAKAFVAEAFARVVARGHEVLGGSGLMDEHEMARFSRRVLEARNRFGDPDEHRDVVASSVTSEERRPSLGIDSWPSVSEPSPGRS